MMNALGNNLSPAARGGVMDVRAALKEAMARLRAAGKLSCDFSSVVMTLVRIVCSWKSSPPGTWPLVDGTSGATFKLPGTAV